MIQRIAQILEGMGDFCRSRKMLLSIREGIAKAKEEIRILGLSNVSHETHLISLEYFLGLQVAKDNEREVEARSAKKLTGLVSEECQTDVEPCGKSTSDSRKLPRELTESPEESTARKPEEKRPKASKQLD